MIDFNKVKIEQELILGKKYIYELSLRKKKTYIGFTHYKKKVHNLPERLWKHVTKTDDSAKYVKKYGAKIKNNILQCKFHEKNGYEIAYEMFLTLQRMDEKGIDMVRGGPFCLSKREYNYREKMVIQYFIKQMKKGWDNFLIYYNIFKHLDADNFYVYKRGFGPRIPTWLYTKKCVIIFNSIIKHIKGDYSRKNAKIVDKDTIYINLDSAMNIIKSVTIENKLTNRNIENKLNNIQSLLIKQNDDMLNLTQKVNLIGQKRNFNEIETNNTEEAGQTNKITETIIIGETITIIEDDILSEPPTKKRKISEA